MLTCFCQKGICDIQIRYDLFFFWEGGRGGGVVVRCGGGRGVIGFFMNVEKKMGVGMEGEGGIVV